jgi:hypothetical protein
VTELLSTRAYNDYCAFRACGNCPVNVTACDEPQCVVANGYEKSVLTINRMVPGPAIQVGSSLRLVRLEPITVHGVEVLQIRRVAANILNTQSRTADKE